MRKHPGRIHAGRTGIQGIMAHLHFPEGAHPPAKALFAADFSRREQAVQHGFRRHVRRDIERNRSGKIRHFPVIELLPPKEASSEQHQSAQYSQANQNGLFHFLRSLSSSPSRGTYRSFSALILRMDFSLTAKRWQIACRVSSSEPTMYLSSPLGASFFLGSR